MIDVTTVASLQLIKIKQVKASYTYVATSHVCMMKL